MKHYRISYTELRKTNSFDQQKMIEALLDTTLEDLSSRPTKTKHFATEAEYLEWRNEQRRNNQT